MELNTTFWNDKAESFSEILLINNNGKSVIFEASLKDKLGSWRFFKNVAKFLLSKPARDSILIADCADWYQFAIRSEKGDILPIIWFSLSMPNKDVISYDMAFGTAIVLRNNRRISLGLFPFKPKRYPMYRELKIKARACKYIANQIKAQWLLED